MVGRLATHTRFCTNFTVYALQEIDHWTLLDTLYSTDHGGTATLCQREVNRFRRSWVDNERCTAFVASRPGCGESTPSWREKQWEPWIFFTGGDLNVELKLCLADDEHRGLDSIEWDGMYGLECEGSAGGLH